MLTKTLVYSLTVALMLVGLCGVAPAAQNVTNVSQKGSLLIFPKIDTSPIGTLTDGTLISRDTIIMISNDYYTEQWIKCYWVDWQQQIQDFMFLLTPNQPIWFRASDGTGTGSADDPNANYSITVPPFFPRDYTVGELKCWAVNAAGDQQVAFNHLYGNAMILDTFHSAAFEYNAWAFTARGVAQGAPVGTGGTLDLSGANGAYDACPQYLLFNFFAIGSSINLPLGAGSATFRETDLTLIPCIQDLRQDRVPTCTKAKFDIWNENETKYTGAYRCIKCWFEGYLDQIDTQQAGKGFGGEKFEYRNLHTTAGRFRVTGVASTVCNNVFKTPDTVYAPGKDVCTGGQVASPLLGLLNTEISFVAAPFDALAGTTPNHAGVGASSTIKWDIQGETPQAPSR
jgi:hypothetical protein